MIAKDESKKMIVILRRRIKLNKVFINKRN